LKHTPENQEIVEQITRQVKAKIKANKSKKRKNEFNDSKPEKTKKERGVSEANEMNNEFPETLKRLLYEDWKMINIKKNVKKKKLYIF
jgi:hypothetical protein